MLFFGSGLKYRLTKAATAVFLGLFCILPCFATFTLDPTFDGDGKITHSIPDSTTNYSSGALRVFIQPNGRIVVGGFYTNLGWSGFSASGVAFVGFTPNGLGDPTFSQSHLWQPDGNTNLQDALMYPDGTTLRMLGIFRFLVGIRYVSVGRNDTNGGHDNIFSSNAGIGGEQPNPIQIALRSDGKILTFISDQGAFYLYRLNPNGTRDTTFGSNGVLSIVFNKFSPTNIVEMIALPDGKILLVGRSNIGAGEFFFGRLTETGMWDKSFGRAGFLRVQFGPGLTGGVSRALLQTDGKILLSGSVTSGDSDAWLARFRPNGRPDPTFGNNGVVIHDFAAGATDAAQSIALSSDGKIRLVGYLGTPRNFLVARFSATGTFEESTTIPFTPNEYAEAADVALQSDGKLVVVGTTRNPNTTATTGSVFAIARLIE
ncbi:MAG: hypothetical protein ACKVQW_09040 [Pyrinomonadaceae bacterium]